jgi:hypothetical protein
VPHVWLVDPSARTLEIFRLAGEANVWVATHENDAVIRAEPFDVIEPPARVELLARARPHRT